MYGKTCCVYNSLYYFFSFVCLVGCQKNINTYFSYFIRLHCILSRRVSDITFMYHRNLSFKKRKLKFKVEYLTFANEINFYGHKGSLFFPY